MGKTGAPQQHADGHAPPDGRHLAAGPVRRGAPVLDAALLGRTSDAMRYVINRALTTPAQGYRFPAFAPHEQDYEPSADHFAVFANALQYMLIQRIDDADTDSVLLLPSWPCSWNVKFRLAAPQNTIVTGALVRGILNYTVSPPSRAAAVIAAKCQEAVPSRPPAPPPAPSPLPKCNYTEWRTMCTPTPAAISPCMACCKNHSKRLFAMGCIGTNCWPDYCAGKPSPGCE